jgi:glutamine amidotransferase
LIAIVDYGVGNLRSAAKALEAASGRLGAGDADVRVTSEATTIDDADAVVLPGVGAFGACMQNLEQSGLVGCVRRAIASGKPFLGICVGMQLLFDESEEFGPVAGLGALPGKVVRFRSTGLKVPHIGWNSLQIARRVPAFDGVPDGTFFHFVHSYYPVPADPALVAATAEYGDERFTAAVARDNVFATQFHPEKSQAAGLTLLGNFVRAAAREPRQAASA